MAFMGCAPAVWTSSPTMQRPASGQTETSEKTYEESGEANEKSSPRTLAALQLIEQGRMFLAKNQPDDAIGILERALNLNPGNGRNYYYLAEAWLMKDNIEQATEFNRLAEIYLKDDSEWLDRVIQQRERIKERNQ